ncbi:MAG: sporulation protein YabP [Lachnospiraceae bacterium]|nr:sporulation protein YabP [Lachnospiraceae bacterium]
MEKGKQVINLIQRENLKVTGVLDVVAFDENGILLETLEGRLHVKGSELKVKKLSEEVQELEVIGRVDSLAYSQGGTTKKGGSLLVKMFR